MKRLASIGSWPWWTVALIGVAWLSLYGFWTLRQLESTAVSLAEICSSLRAGCNLTVEPVWYQYVLWAGCQSLSSAPGGSRVGAFRGLPNKRLKLPARVNCGMSLSSARRSLSAVR